MNLDWTQVLTVFAIVATNVVTVITLYLHTDSKIEANRKETNDILKGIQEEMKDFHSRLMKIEMERNQILKG
jgi:hypothetical protein